MPQNLLAFDFDRNYYFPLFTNEMLVIIKQNRKLTSE